MKTFHIEQPDQQMRPLLEAKINDLTKPKGALGRLEELALQVGLIQQTLRPTLHHPCNILFGGDHGIADEGEAGDGHTFVARFDGALFGRGGSGVDAFVKRVFL